jgi:hypothetical protein
MTFLLLLLPAILWAGENPRDLIPTTAQEPILLVDPDPAQLPLPKLVLPPAEPPASLRLPAMIMKSDEWKGVRCAVTEPRWAVFRNPDRWSAFWEKAMAPYVDRMAKVPKVDFDKDMVVGVFMGEMPYPNYEIDIRSVRAEDQPGRGRALVVRYREITKMRGVFVPPFDVQPFHLRRVPRFSGDVVFQKIRR